MEMNLISRINSAFRCQKHNKEVGGAKDSQHLTGMAIDLQFSKEEIEKARKFAEKNFNGLGIGKTYLHCDTRSKKTMWFY